MNHFNLVGPMERHYGEAKEQNENGPNERLM